MSNIMKSLACGAVITLVAACSVPQKQTPSAERQGAEWEKMVEAWGDPNTTMKLPNGNLLYVFGDGRSEAVWTPAVSVPGQHLYTVNEQGRPTRIVACGEKKEPGDRGVARNRVVWIEANAAGTILLAGCAGCNEEEHQALAALQEGRAANLRASTTPWQDRP